MLTTGWLPCVRTGTPVRILDEARQARRPYHTTRHRLKHHSGEGGRVIPTSLALRVSEARGGHRGAAGFAHRVGYLLVWQ